MVKLKERNLLFLIAKNHVSLQLLLNGWVVQDLFFEGGPDLVAIKKHDVARIKVRYATKNNGAREVHIVEEPMAAAIGIRLPVEEPIGNMVIDIGGGTSDIAVISLGGIVRSKSLKIAGDRFNEDIIAYIRSEFHKIRHILNV